MKGVVELLWRALPGVRRSERSRFLFFAALFTLVSTAETLGFVGSEALFLSQVGVERLPVFFIAASAATVLGTLVYASAVGVVRNDRIFVWMLLGTAAVIGAGAVGAAAGSAVVLGILFCLYYVTFAVFVNHFWTFAGDYFDTSTTKRLFPLFTIGSSLGGAVGGGLAFALNAAVGPVALLAGWSGFLVLAALLLRAGRRRLLRWGPLDLEEADETSFQGMQGAARYLRGSPLGRWLMLSALAMVLALFVAQYLYSAVFAAHFGSAAALATFFALYQAGSNVIEIALEVALTPWLLRRFGVGSANLLHPALTVLTFAGLARWYALPMGIVARVNRELLENAVAGPLRALVYNAIPMRYRGRLRAFLEGVVIYGGMALAGVALLAMGDPDPTLLAAAGGGIAVLYLVANWRTRREYLRALVREMRAGRLDLDQVGDELGAFEAGRLAELWEEMVRAEGSRPSSSLLRLVPELAARGIVAPLVRESAHPSPAVRRACVSALASVRGESAERTLLQGLADVDASVRLAALRGLAGRGAATGRHADRLRRLLRDPDPTVRVEAARDLGAEGSAVLYRMARSRDPAEAAAALHGAEPALAEVALSRVRDPHPGVRAAALEALARSDLPAVPALEDSGAALRDPAPAVRRAAVYALAGWEEDEAREALAGALGDPASEVRFAVETVLASQGAEAIPHLRPRLRADEELAAQGALRVMARSGDSDAREILQEELRHHAGTLWRFLIGFQRLPESEDLAARFRRAAYRDAMMRHRRLAFLVLELLETPGLVRSVLKALRLGSPRARGDALEVLSNLGDREATALLGLVHESGSFAERAEKVGDTVSVPEDPAELLEGDRASESRWVRMAARAVEARARGILPEQELMDRLLALKQVPLFEELSLDQLEAVLRISREVELVPGEVVMKEGDPGGLLYILLEGSVRVVKDFGESNERLLATMSAVNYLGEMAILDDEPRSATAVAVGPARFLALDGASLKELILQMPEISFEIFRVLTARIRQAESRLSER